MLFKMNPELLSPEAIKSLVKGLRKGMKDEMGVDVPQHSAQEVLSRTLGYPNWHALKQREVTRPPGGQEEHPQAPHQKALVEAFALAEQAKVKGVMIYLDEQNDETVLDLWVDGEGTSAETYHRHDVAAGTWAKGKELGEEANLRLGEKMEEWENHYFDLHERHDEAFDPALKQGRLRLSDRNMWLTQGGVHAVLPAPTQAVLAELPMKPSQHVVHVHDVPSRREKALAEAFDLAARIPGSEGIALVTEGATPQGRLRLLMWTGKHHTVSTEEMKPGALRNVRPEPTEKLAQAMMSWEREYANLHFTDFLSDALGACMLRAMHRTAWVMGPPLTHDLLFGSNHAFAQKMQEARETWLQSTLDMAKAIHEPHVTVPVPETSSRRRRRTP